MKKPQTKTEKDSEVSKKKNKTVAKVKASNEAAKSLNDLFEDCLKDALWAENALLKALPKMAKNATSPKLKKALLEHCDETSSQVEILKEVFNVIKVKPNAEKCDAMAGILEEADGILKETVLGAVRDAGIIAACQKAEHYEIASYGTMVAYAKILKISTAKKLLSEILLQEKSADKLLSKLAITEINLKAR